MGYSGQTKAHNSSPKAETLRTVLLQDYDNTLSLAHLCWKRTYNALLTQGIMVLDVEGCYPLSKQWSHLSGLNTTI